MGGATPLPVAPADDPPSRRLSLELDAEALRRAGPAALLPAVAAMLPGIDRHRGVLATILSELWANALDHGILGLDSGLKSGPGGLARYFAERERRLAGLCHGTLRIEVEHRRRASGGEIAIRVEDGGPGFDHAAHRPGPGGASPAGHGRGIGILRALCSELRFNARGNRVDAVYEWR